MSAVSRVSAFAKRRRVNDDPPEAIEPAVPDASQPSAKKFKAKEVVKQWPKRQTQDASLPTANETYGTELTPSDASNSFEPLVQADVVTFIGTREIEQLDERSYRIRLSRGQRCTIQGIARLWIKDGNVRCSGVALQESTILHTIYGPSHEQTEIIATSKTAEFELQGLRFPAIFDPSPDNIPGRLGHQARASDTSFTVLQQAQDGASTFQNEVDDLTAQVQQTLRSSSSQTQAEHTAVRTALCGKNNNSTQKASLALLNHLLTKPSRTKSAGSSPRIALLDLDYISPMFTAPGNISLAILTKPIFGPCYSQPLQVSSQTNTSRLMAAHYIRAVEDSDRPTLEISTIENVLAFHKLPPDLPLLVRTGPWLANSTPSELTRLRTILDVNLVVCTDLNKSSAFSQAARSLSNTPESIVSLAVLHSGLSTLFEHKLLLQSHFRLYDYAAGDTPLWYRDPIPNTSARRLELSTSKIAFIQIRGGILRAQDIPLAIENNLVVLVGSKSRGSPERSEVFLARDDHAASTDDENSIELDFENAENHDRLIAEPNLDFSGTISPFLKSRDETDATTLDYLGLAYVETVNVPERRLTLNTPVTSSTIEQYVDNGYEIGLVLEKPDVDGRFGRHLLFE